MVTMSQCINFLILETLSIQFLATGGNYDVWTWHSPILKVVIVRLIIEHSFYEFSPLWRTAHRLGFSLHTRFVISFLKSDFVNPYDLCTHARVKPVC